MQLGTFFFPSLKASGEEETKKNWKIGIWHAYYNYDLLEWVALAAWGLDRDLQIGPFVTPTAEWVAANVVALVFLRFILVKASVEQDQGKSPFCYFSSQRKTYIVEFPLDRSTGSN